MGQTPPKAGQYYRVGIPDDERGIAIEIDRMVQYVQHFRADPLVVDAARRIVEECRERDSRCEIVSLYKWVCEYTRFVNDPHDIEVLQTPKRMLVEIIQRNQGRRTNLKPRKASGDCDELSTLLATLIAAIGIVPRFRFGGNRTQGIHHVWVQADVDGDDRRWLDMDPSLCLKEGKHHRFQIYSVREIFD